METKQNRNTELGETNRRKRQNIQKCNIVIILILCSAAGTSNTYRLGSQRKPLYAQPPGLSASSPNIPSPVGPYSSSNSGNLSLSTNVPKPQTSPMATLTPTPLQYQSPVNAENQSVSSVVPPSFTNLVIRCFLSLQVGLHPLKT